jgi:hypothetical protein
MPKNNNQEFPTKWEKEIEKSGKFFEQEIVTLICESGFGFVIPNYAFLDIEEGKSREMDVFAISGYGIGRKGNFVFPVLLISVSNRPIVCFTRKEYVSRYTAADIHFSGMPKNIYLRDEEFELFDFLGLEDFHHYYKAKKISSQFWTPLKKKESQGEYFYKELILPLIKAVVAEKMEHEKNWYFDPEGEPINLQFYYPIIVVKDLWECSFIENKASYNRTDHVLFLFHTATKAYAGDYLIDICTKEGLNTILKNIDNEIKKIVEIIKKKRQLFEKSAFKEAKEREK